MGHVTRGMTFIDPAGIFYRAATAARLECTAGMQEPEVTGGRFSWHIRLRKVTGGRFPWHIRFATAVAKNKQPGQGFLLFCKTAQQVTGAAFYHAHRADFAPPMAGGQGGVDPQVIGGQACVVAAVRLLCFSLGP
jgi:hypothetical protein